MNRSGMLAAAALLCAGFAVTGAAQAGESETAIRGCMANYAGSMDEAHARASCLCQFDRLKKEFSAEDYRLFIGIMEILSRDMPEADMSKEMIAMFKKNGVAFDAWLQRTEATGRKVEAACKGG